MTQELSIRAFFDQATNTVTYLVWDATLVWQGYAKGVHKRRVVIGDLSAIAAVAHPN